MGWIGCIRFEKLQQQFVSQNMTLGSKGWIGCVHCEKFRHDYVAHTFALIAPVLPVLHQVSCTDETIPNAPNHYETHQNMSLGYNGVNRVRSLRKIMTRLRGTNLCINCTSSTHFTISFMSNERIPNAPKRKETHQNMSLGYNGVDRERLF